MRARPAGSRSPRTTTAPSAERSWTLTLSRGDRRPSRPRWPRWRLRVPTPLRLRLGAESRPLPPRRSRALHSPARMFWKLIAVAALTVVVAGAYVGLGEVHYRNCVNAAKVEWG